MYNKAILMGRICNDLEVKTTPSGAAVLSFRLAVDRSYQAKGEERKSDFFNIVAWRNNADFISRFFGKGKMILVEGELQTRQYTDKNNSTQTIVELIVETARFTGEKSNNQGSGNVPPPPEPPQTQPQAQQSAPPTYTAEDFMCQPTDDDYPF